MTNGYVGADFFLPAITQPRFISKEELEYQMKNNKGHWNTKQLAKILKSTETRDYTCPNCPYPHDPAFKCEEQQ